MALLRVQAHQLTPLAEFLLGHLEQQFVANVQQELARELRARDAALDARHRMEKVTEGLDKLRRKYAQRVVLPATLIGREKLGGRDGSSGKLKV